MCVCVSERALISVALEMAWSGMLRSAEIGNLGGQTRESPQQLDLVLYEQLVPPRTPLLSKNTCSCCVAPFPTPLPLAALKYPASFTISAEIPIFGVFFLNFVLCSLALPDVVDCKPPGPSRKMIYALFMLFPVKL